MSTTETTTKAQISISEVLSMLAGGQDRDAIRIHYDLTKAQAKRLFSHPKLKGKKIKNSTKNDPFVIVDDVPEAKTSPASTATEAPTSSESTTEAPATGETEAPTTNVEIEEGF